MKIREAIIGDESLLLDLFKLLDSETDHMLFEPGERRSSPEEQAKLIEQFSHSNSHLLLVCKGDRGISGFLGATGGQTSRNQHMINFAMGVNKADWGKGIGTSLLSNFEKWAISHNYHRIEMTVQETNLRAQNLYLKMGFQREGIRKHSLWYAKFLPKHF